MTHPSQKGGNDENTSNLETFGRKKDLRRLSSHVELMLSALPFLSSFINIIQNSIGFILGLYLGHFFGPCFRPTFMSHVLGQLE